MAKLPYVTLNVFTTQPLTSGNPLAVVKIPPEVSLTKSQEHLIAREFGYSETVFIYPSSQLRDEEQRGKGYTKIAIWTVTQELPFAGHPTVGTGWYLLCDNRGEDTGNGGGDGGYSNVGKLLTLAGIVGVERIPTTTGTGKVRVDTPHDITIWEKLIPRGRISEVVGMPYEYFDHDDKIFESDGVHEVAVRALGMEAGEGVPVVSIVPGMSFALVQVKSVSVLQGMKTGRKGVELDMVSDLDAVVPAGGRPFIGVYAYAVLAEKVVEEDGDGEDGGKRKKGVVVVRSRMFFGGDGEDPATGSAACALGSYLSIVKGADGEVGEWEFEITQGVEMGRRSDIGVRVLLEEGKGRRGVKKVYLEGESVKVMEGTLTI